MEPARPLSPDRFAKTMEWHNVDLATLRDEIVPRDRPAILRGLVKDWPAVRAGRESPQAFCDYIKSFDIGRAVQTAIGPPEIKGRLFYRDDMRGFNFERKTETFRAALERLFVHRDDPQPPAIYAGAVSTAE